MLVMLLAGAGGGVVRGIAGFLKHYFAYKNVKFELNYFLMTTGLSALVGLAVSWAVTSYDLESLGLAQATPAMAFMVGYAGGDFLENVYKMIAGKISFFPTLPK